MSALSSDPAGELAYAGGDGERALRVARLAGTAESAVVMLLPPRESAAYSNAALAIRAP